MELQTFLNQIFPNNNINHPAHHNLILCLLFNLNIIFLGLFFSLMFVYVLCKQNLLNFYFKTRYLVNEAFFNYTEKNFITDTVKLQNLLAFHIISLLKVSKTMVENVAIRQIMMANEKIPPVKVLVSASPSNLSSCIDENKSIFPMIRFKTLKTISIMYDL